MHFIDIGAYEARGLTGHSNGAHPVCVSCISVAMPQVHVLTQALERYRSYLSSTTEVHYKFYIFIAVPVQPTVISVSPAWYY